MAAVPAANARERPMPAGLLQGSPDKLGGSKLGGSGLRYWVIGLLGYWVIGLLGYWVIGLLGFAVLYPSSGIRGCIFMQERENEGWQYRASAHGFWQVDIRCFVWLWAGRAG